MAKKVKKPKEKEKDEEEVKKPDVGTQSTHGEDPPQPPPDLPPGNE